MWGRIVKTGAGTNIMNLGISKHFGMPGAKGAHGKAMGAEMEAGHGSLGCSGKDMNFTLKAKRSL